MFRVTREDRFLLRPSAAELRRQVQVSARPQRPGHHRHRSGPARRPRHGARFLRHQAGRQQLDRRQPRPPHAPASRRSGRADPQKLGEPLFLIDANPTAENIAKLIFDFSQEPGFPDRRNAPVGNAALLRDLRASNDDGASRLRDACPTRPCVSPAARKLYEDCIIWANNRLTAGDDAPAPSLWHNCCFPSSRVRKSEASPTVAGRDVEIIETAQSAKECAAATSGSDAEIRRNAEGEIVYRAS